jgi:VanZ family protein
MILIWLTIKAAKLKSMHKFDYILKFLFWTSFVVINVLALSPAPFLPPEIFDWWDKAQHAIAFAGLAVLAVFAYPDVSKLRIALLLISQGGVIEVLQYFSGYRYGDWQDALADGVGVLLGLGVGAWLMRREWFKRMYSNASTTP